MPYRFDVEHSPSEARCERIASLSPDNPFYTARFVAARRQCGVEPWILSLADNGNLVTACTAFMATGRLGRRFEIQSLPRLPEDPTFWIGLYRFCRDHKVTELVVNTFGSGEACIPRVASEIWRRSRVEFALDLRGEELLAKTSSNHRRNITRAVNAGLVIRDATSFDGCSEHARLVVASTYRRQQRGEHVPVRNDAELFQSFVGNGAGKLYQAVCNDIVLSSVLVLMASTVGYHHSAGTTQQGMRLGASHFLISGIAERLRNEGLSHFNLGGASIKQLGLFRFKAGFGATRIDLEAAAFTFDGPLLKVVRLAQRALRLDSQI